MLEPLQKLTKDIRESSRLLTAQEARYLVDAYYQMQDNRMRSNNQVRAMEEEPTLVLGWLAEQSESLENSIKNALHQYAKSQPIGIWLLSQYGIGPVISAGLMAHIDIRKADTAAKIWRYAGLDPTVKWEKGQKRPWNASLKVLAWKAGQSFLKQSGKDECFYGKMYREHKQLLIQRNENMEFKDYALEKATKVGKSTEAYKAYSIGKLPAGHIDARARRYAVKAFLSHLQQVWWELETKTPAHVPYCIAHMGHKDYIPPPNYTPLPR